MGFFTSSRGLKRKFLDRQQAARDCTEDKMPTVQLQAKHVESCQALLNREKLLEQMPKGAVVAEIGVDQGEFSKKILSRCQPHKLILVDSWSTERYGENKALAVERSFEDQIKSGEVSIVRALSIDALSNFPEHSLDWVYIDTDHSYETTRDELAAAEKLIKPGGYIAGHDYVGGNWRSGYRYGVIEAVHEFCVTRNWRFAYITLDASENPSFALQKLD